MLTTDLHAVAAFIASHSWITNVRREPGVPLTINYGVRTATDVYSLAEAAHAPVTVQSFETGTTTRTTIQKGEVELTVFHIARPPAEVHA